MSKQWMVLVAIAVLATAPEVSGQETSLAFETPPVTSALPVPGERSPFLAGVLTIVFPGLGSFYAGNSGHGVRHGVIGLVTGVAYYASADDCIGDIFGQNESSCGLFIVSSLAFLANTIWATVVAVDDTKAYNRSLQTAGLRVAPELVAVRSGGNTQLGLQLVSFGF